MWDYGGIDKLIKTVEGTGQRLSHNHFGRTENSLVLDKSIDTRTTQNISEDYYWSWQDGWSYYWSVAAPYLSAKRAENPDYDPSADPDFPETDDGLASRVIDKYQVLSSVPLQLAENVVQGGGIAEIQPYWERMLIDTVIQAETSAEDYQRIDAEYHQQGRDGLVDIFQNEEYLSTRVLFSYAQGDAFLRLDEANQLKFVTMSLTDQYELVFLDESERINFIEARTGYLTSLDTADYDNDLQEAKKDIDLGLLMSRFEAHLQQTGTDYVVRFEQTFEAQTRDTDFSSISTPLKNVYQLYQGVLGRNPDKAGFEYWLTNIKFGSTQEKIAEGFVGSVEFIAAAGIEPGTEPTFDQLLTSLYKVVLDRDYDQEGYDYWYDLHVNQGASLGAVVTGFTNSLEFSNNIAAEKQGWLSATYGPNLVDMDFTSLFSADQVDNISLVGVSYDPNLDLGHTGTLL